MEMEMLNGMLIPISVVFCLCVGYIIKHWINDVNNRYIPVILAVLGAAVACAAKQDISLELVIGGMLSGLASTGLHQAFKQFLEGERNDI